MPGDVRKVALALRVGGGDSVDEVAEEYGVDEETVSTAVEWAAEHPDKVRGIIEERAESLAALPREYPSRVDPPREQSAADYKKRQLVTLESVVRRFS